MINTLDSSQLSHVNGAAGAKWDPKGVDRGGMDSLGWATWNACASGHVPGAVQDAMRGGGSVPTDKLIGPIGHPETYGCSELYKNYLLRRGAVNDWQVPGFDRK